MTNEGHASVDDLLTRNWMAVVLLNLALEDGYGIRSLDIDLC